MRQPTPMDVLRLVQTYREDRDTDAFNAALDELYKPPPEPTCNWCGATDSDTEDMEWEWPGLTDIEVLVAAQEEGFSHVRKWVCSKEFESVMLAIKAIGFVDHRHGGICFLEAPTDECGGYNKCQIEPLEE